MPGESCRMTASPLCDAAIISLDPPYQVDRTLSMANHIKTTLLLALLTGVLITMGNAFGGTSGMVIAFGFAIAMNFGSWWFSDRIVLTMYKAREVTGDEVPGLLAMVQRLARKADLPMPRVYVIPDASPNAFATGRNPQNAAVAVTAGLLEHLSPNEVEGVLAHELGHVANRDILISSIAATLAGAVTMLASIARWGLILGGRGGGDRNPLSLLLSLILAPIAAMIIQMAVSRSREYAADAYAARLVGSGIPLARALRRLEWASQRVPSQARSATAHMFIVNPMMGGLKKLFSTHPNTDERIRRLESIQP